jgi:hypothetical protein
MFAASAEYLLNNLLSRICLLRFFKYNELKMSKTNFFQMAPRIYYCIEVRFLQIQTEKCSVYCYLWWKIIT